MAAMPPDTPERSLPYDKAFADLAAWLKANGLIVRIPKNGPIRIERAPPK